MSAIQPAVSLLEDTVVTAVIGTTGDTGVRDSFGASPLTFLVDKISGKASMDTADHSAGQSLEPITRGTKLNGELNIEMKLFTGTHGVVALTPGTQFKLTGVATVGAGTVQCVIVGIVTESEAEISGPSTLKVTVKPYGVDTTRFITWSGT